MTEDPPGLDAVAAVLRAGFPLRGPRGTIELADPPLTADSYAVWANVCVGDAAGGLFLFGARRLDDPRAPAFVQGWIDALLDVATLATPESLPRFAPGWLDVRMPLEVLDAPDARGYRAELRKRLWLGRLLPEKDRTPMRAAYERAPEGAVVEADGKISRYELAEWILAHVELRFDDETDRRALAALPAPARALWYGANFDNQAGGNGLANFLQSQPQHLIDGTYRAMRTLGARGLHDLFRRALEGGEDPSPFDGHAPGQTWNLIDTELRNAMQSYAERHRSDLIR